MAELTGKVALVTGGSRGIGAAIARRLAREGADVALTYMSSPEKAHAVAAEIEAMGRRVRPIRADSGDPSAVIQAVERTVSELGRIDALVNNAGVGVWKPLGDYTLDDFDHVVSVNVRAVFLASQAAARHMTSGGRIITIGSCMTERVPGPYATLYALSKSALVGMTKGMARDLGPRGITVNVVQPGPTDTDMNPADGPRADGLRAIMAIPQYAAGKDIAALVAYLAGGESGFVTGASWMIDGGYTI